MCRCESFWSDRGVQRTIYCLFLKNFALRPLSNYVDIKGNGDLFLFFFRTLDDGQRPRKNQSHSLLPSRTSHANAINTES